MHGRFITLCFSWSKWNEVEEKANDCFAHILCIYVVRCNSDSEASLSGLLGLECPECFPLNKIKWFHKKLN